MNRPLSPKRNASGRAPRMVIRQRQTMSRRMIVAASGIFTVVATMGIVIYFQLGKVETAYAAATGDYRAVATGNWNSISTWEKYNGSSWVAATAVPSSTDGAIEIQSPYSITVSADVTADQL